VQAGRQCMHQRRRCSPCMLMPALLGLRAQQHARQECAAGRAARGRPRGAPFARCSSTVSPPPESAKRLILFLICAAVSVTKMALLGSLPLILPVSPCTGARASRARACTRSAAGAQFVPARRSLRSRSLQACRTLHRLKQAHAWAAAAGAAAAARARSERARGRARAPAAPGRSATRAARPSCGPSWARRRASCGSRGPAAARRARVGGCRVGMR